MLEQAANGAFSRAVDCAQADTIAGGCRLTDAREAKTEQAGLYSQLSKKAGFNCDVAGYAVLPSQASAPTTEVVELKCSNRPDGAIAMFPPKGSASVYDCAHSEIVGYRCSLTKPSAAYASLTKDLSGLGKTSCVVSEARMVGVTADKHAYVEVGCADGLQGYMIEYTPNPVTAKTHDHLQRRQGHRRRLHPAGERQEELRFGATGSAFAPARSLLRRRRESPRRSSPRRPASPRTAARCRRRAASGRWSG